MTVHGQFLVILIFNLHLETFKKLNFLIICLFNDYCESEIKFFCLAIWISLSHYLDWIIYKMLQM